MTLSFMNNKGYIFIVQRLGKQSKLILSRLDSISNLELNLKIHGSCGPNAHAGTDLQAFLIFCFKPVLLPTHKLSLLIYGDNTHRVTLGYLEPEDDPKQSHRLYPVLPRLWRRGHTPHGLGVRVAEAQGIPRAAKPASPRGS